MAAKVLLAVKVPSDHLVGLQNLANKDDRTLAEYVREMLRDHIRAKRDEALSNRQETAVG